MAKAPAFQFYVKDWLSSRRVQVMTPEQEGAYIRLLCYCWESGDCSIPDDDDELAILSRLGEGWLKGSSKIVRRCFEAHPDKPGFLTNARLLNEMKKQSAWQEKCAKGGKESGKKRAEKAKKTSESKGSSTKGQPDTAGLVELNGNTASSSSSSSSSAEKKEAKTTPSESATAAPVPAPKPKPPRKEPTGPHHDAIRAFTSRWNAKYGEKYPFAPKDADAIAGMLARCDGDVEKFAGCVERFLADTDQFYHGHGTKIMESKLERWFAKPPPKQLVPHGRQPQSRGQAELDFAARMAADAFGAPQ